MILNITFCFGQKKEGKESTKKITEIRHKNA